MGTLDTSGLRQFVNESDVATVTFSFSEWAPKTISVHTVSFYYYNPDDAISNTILIRDILIESTADEYWCDTSCSPIIVVSGPATNSFSFDGTTCNQALIPPYNEDDSPQSVCVVTSSAYNNPYNASTSYTSQFKCPFNNMFISNVTFGTYAAYFPLLGPNDCSGSTGIISTPSCVIPNGGLIASVLNTYCKGLSTCAIPTSPTFWKTFYPNLNCPNSVLYLIWLTANYTCSPIPRSSCYIYDTFCDPYGVGFNYTGGLLQWAAPWVPQYSPLLNIPPFNFPVLTQCQGLISPDQNCLHFNVLTGSSIANLLCSSASVTLRNISFVYTIVVQGSTNVIITVDGVVVSNKLISSSYNGELRCNTNLSANAFFVCVKGEREFYCECSNVVEYNKHIGFLAWFLN